VTRRNPKYPDSARRALALRLYCGFPGHGGQKDFANWLGPDLTYVLWGAVERGEARFSFRLIGIIKQKLPTVDTEWLRDGVEGRCH